MNSAGSASPFRRLLSSFEGRASGVLRSRFTLPVAALATIAAASCGGGGEDDTVLVAAAASLTDALTEIGRTYEAESGANVEFTFGGSAALARQVELGAPVDAVIFAGASPMDRLTAGSELLDGTRTDLLRNRVVVIGDAGEQALEDLGRLLALDGRIAIADPALAPAGQYGRQALQSAALWDELERRIIPTLDVRAAVGAVDTGAARFGVVYATDAAAAGGVHVVFEVPEELHDPVVYPAAVVRRSGAPDAALRFLEFLGGDAASGIFRRHGFTPVER